jgi:hypothetical protein
MGDGGFRLDGTALQRLNGEISALREDLTTHDATRADIDQAEAGDAGVFAAIEAFDSNWRDGRARIVDNLQRTGDTLARTLHNYEATEHGTTTQFTEAGGGL